MIQADSILTGVQQLLFGNLRPATTLEGYEHGDRELFHRFYELPQSPEFYLQSDPAVRVRWEERINEEIKQEWIAPWYHLPDSKPESFHILCEFYRAFTWCECRMIMHTAESWRMDFSMDQREILYEFLILQGELVELLRECQKRINPDQSDENSLQVRLNSFLVNLLKNQLLMTFLEWQKRYGDLLEDNIIPKKKLYLKYLEIPVPDHHPWHGTSQLTLHELELACRPPGIHENIKNLLIQQKKNLGGKIDDSVRHEMHQSLIILENAWLTALVIAENEQKSTINISDPAENAGRLKLWNEILSKDENPGNENGLKPIIGSLLSRISEIKATLNTDGPGHISEAAELIYELEHLFTPTEEPKAPDGRTSESPASVKSKEHWLLQSYIPYNSVKEKFEIDYKTFKKYLQNSKIRVIEFSQKNRWIHKDDVKAFLESHQKLI